MRGSVAPEHLQAFLLQAIEFEMGGLEVYEAAPEEEQQRRESALRARAKQERERMRRGGERPTPATPRRSSLGLGRDHRSDAVQEGRLRIA